VRILLRILCVLSSGFTVSLQYSCNPKPAAMWISSIGVLTRSRKRWYS